MSEDYSKEIDKNSTVPKSGSSVMRKIIGSLLVIVWVGVSFALAQLVTIALIRVLILLHVPLAYMNEAILNTVVASFIYVITLVLVIGLPILIKKDKISLKFLGINRLPSWTDIWTAPAGFIIYIILSVILMSVAAAILPWFDVNQAQDVGFSGLNFRYEYVLAFVTLVIIAPVAEEILFRGYLLGKLRKMVPLWLAILLTSVAFGAIHGAWNLAIDTFALSVVLCVLRVTSGSLWAPVLLHMTKNSIAFYILFINPTIFNTLGG